MYKLFCIKSKKRNIIKNKQKKMRIFDSHLLVNSYLIDSPQYSNISNLSLSSLCNFKGILHNLQYLPYLRDILTIVCILYVLSIVINIVVKLVSNSDYYTNKYYTIISKANSNYLYVVIFIFVLALITIMLGLYIIPEYLIPRTGFDELVNLDLISITGIDDPVTSDPMPGVRCPKCAARGVESWVLSGKYCPKCGHPCRW